MMKKSTMKIKGRMEREGGEEDLSLFRELRKRQSERVSSLLQFASEDYDFDSNNAKFSLYRVPSGKKEYEYLAETNKNEYDWLKTPPATPLFPSLEMEPNAHLVLQKEIPISQPISRFAGNDEKQLKSKQIIDAKPKPNHSNLSKAKVPMRSITPSHNRQRPTTSIIKNNNTNTNNEHKQLPNIHHHNHNNIITKKSIIDTNSIAPQKQPKKSMEANESLGMKPKTRGVSPSVRSTRIASNFVLDLDLPNEAPPNLRTERRASSTTRGRSTTRGSKLVGTQNQDPIPRSIVRPSRSPSPCVSNNKNNGGWNHLEKTQKSLRAQKEKFTLAAGGSNENGAHFMGSKMVEKVVKARKSGINNQAEKETKPKPLKYKV
ncbi:uncharacterized protein LOC130943520 [Arachis stenosperma]|uniref:uncharacterized protein LOC130943520 n=1 Tax=Arachis stenosperma TaxID=217475 RepID=UPI0025AB6856|nr:uncharacterized protein LOC130943520 [Arachis stenosperma]